MKRRKVIGWALVTSTVLVATVAGAVLVAVRAPLTYDLVATEGAVRTGKLPAWASDWLVRFGEAVLPHLDPGDTEYAPGFDEEAFLRIAIGAPEDEVLQKLGPPLAKKSFSEPIMQQSFPGPHTVWYYSQHGPSSKSYFVRALLFDQQGRVARRLRRYYVD